MSVVIRLSWIVMAATSGSGPAVVAIDRLHQPVRFDGGMRLVTARAVLDAISDQTGVPCVLDPSVPMSRLQQRLPMTVHHVTGYEGLRAVAHMLDLELVVVRHQAMLISSEGVPSVWRTLIAKQRRQASERRAASRAAWTNRMSRRTALHIVDATLPAAVARMRDAFEVDILMPAEIWYTQSLVSLSDDGATLLESLDRLAARLGVWVRCEDGVAWLSQSDVADGRNGSVGEGRVRWVEPPKQAQLLRATPTSRLGQPVRISAAPRSRHDFLTEAARQAGATLRLNPESTYNANRIVVYEADGSLGEILEAARLNWGPSWRIAEESDGEHWLVTVSPAADP